MPAHSRAALTVHLAAHGVPDTGLAIIFVVESNPAYPFEVFYSWVTFPAVDATDYFFQEYTPSAVPARYEPYRTLEVPLTAWQHTIWFIGALPNVFTPVRLGPLSIDGATWPVLAGYALHPCAITGATIAQLRVLHDELVRVHRAVIQFMSRSLQLVLAATAATHQAGAAGGVTISPIMVNSVMGKTSLNRDDFPYWLAEKFGQLDAVFPHTSLVEKHSFVTISLPKDLIPDAADCNTWGQVFAAVYTRCFGTPSMQVLPSVIKKI